jgi:hypothetical protein
MNETAKERWQEHLRRKPFNEIPPAHNHTLRHDPFSHRWSCKCGYVLGDGREKLLAPCPLTLIKKPKARKEKHETRKRKSKDASSRKSRRR